MYKRMEVRYQFIRKENPIIVRVFDGKMSGKKNDGEEKEKRMVNMIFI